MAAQAGLTASNMRAPHLLQATDVYSWGVLLWEMLAGANAWAGLRHAQVEGCVLQCAASRAHAGKLCWETLHNLAAALPMLLCAGAMQHVPLQIIWTLSVSLAGWAVPVVLVLHLGWS